jgi:hypothetical protein
VLLSMTGPLGDKTVAEAEAVSVAAIAAGAKSANKTLRIGYSSSLRTLLSSATLRLTEELRSASTTQAASKVRRSRRQKTVKLIETQKKTALLGAVFDFTGACRFAYAETPSARR